MLQKIVVYSVYHIQLKKKKNQETQMNCLMSYYFLVPLKLTSTASLGVLVMEMTQETQMNYLTNYWFLVPLKLTSTASLGVLEKKMTQETQGKMLSLKCPLYCLWLLYGW